MTLSSEYYFQSLSYYEVSTLIPCPVDRDDIEPLKPKKIVKTHGPCIFIFIYECMLSQMLAERMILLTF